MSNLSSLFTGGGIKSVQRGAFSFTSLQTLTTVSITAVDTSKSFITFSNIAPLNNSQQVTQIQGRITSSTGLTFARNSSGSSLTGVWEVVEYE